MDLAKLDTVARANEGFELQLFNPGTMENLGIYITVLGRDSTEFRELQAEQNKKRMAKLAKGGSFRMGAVNLTEVERDSIELLAACTKSWRQDVPGAAEGEATSLPTLTLDGQELACNAANATKLYTAYPWIREQVDAGVTDRANFIKP